MIVYVVYKDNEENSCGDYMKSTHKTFEGATAAISKLKENERNYNYYHIAEEQVQD